MSSPDDGVKDSRGHRAPTATSSGPHPSAAAGAGPASGHGAGERTAPVPPGEQPTRQGGARGVGRTLGHGIGRAATGAVRVTAATGRYATDRFRTYTHSGGAGETGLSRLTELHATHTAGDAAMAIALAGTLFFNPQTAQARSQVAWFLLLTMVPFVLVAPLVGPLLDRFSHGRRWAIGTTLALRGFLCWVLADLLASDSGWLFPAALLFLVASKAYTIARAAAVPRLLPRGTTLVRANSMMSIAGVVGALLGGVVGGVGLKFGAPWALRGAFVVFVIGTVQAIRLDPRVDSTEGEARLGDTAPIPVERAQRHTSRRRTKGVPAEGAALQVDSAGFVARFRRRRQAIPWPVMHAMWSTGGTRVLTGFLLLYLAFLARERPIDGVRGEVVLGLIAVAVGVGNVLGSLLGNRLSDRAPERIAMLSVLASTLACVATGLWYGIWTLVVLGLVQGLGAQVSRLCFDALVQREVPENVRASVFAWAETLLQVLWVAGGALGIMLPLNPRVGFLVCAAALVLTIIMAARQRRVSGPPLGGSGMPGTVR